MHRLFQLCSVIKDFANIQPLITNSLFTIIIIPTLSALKIKVDDLLGNHFLYVILTI